MSFAVGLSRGARNRLGRLDKDLKERVGQRIGQLALDPFDARISKPLTYPRGYRSSRVGGWRLLYTVNLDERIVEVLSLEPRGQVYRGV